MTENELMDEKMFSEHLKCTFAHSDRVHKAVLFYLLLFLEVNL